MRGCVIENCKRRHYARGWCSIHYHRWRQYGDPTKIKFLSLEEKFNISFEVHPNGCWNWKKPSTSGYGRFQICFGNRPQTILAHRFSYELKNGLIPPGLSVRHKCDNRRCVNPDHLILGTAKDNTADAIARGRSRGRFSGMSKEILCGHHEAKFFAKGKCRKCYMKDYQQQFLGISRWECQ